MGSKKKRRKKIARLIEIGVTIVSLAIALVSLLVSWVALEIAERTFELSSQDYVPPFEVSFGSDGIPTHITNPNSDLYDVQEINVLEVSYYAIEDYEMHGAIDFSFVTFSGAYFAWPDESLGKEIELGKGTMNGMCSHVCEYSQTLRNELDSMLDIRYEITDDPGIGFMAPSAQSKVVYIEIFYMNKNLQPNTVVMRRFHQHGVGGYDTRAIDRGEFRKALQDAEKQSFRNVTRLWDHLVKNYFVPYNSPVVEVDSRKVDTFQ